MQEYVDHLLGQVDGQTWIADKVFPSPGTAMTIFVKQVLDHVLLDYATQLIDKTRHGSETEVYLKAVVGTYQQCQRLVKYLNKPRGADDSFLQHLSDYLDTLFESHIEPYLRVESDHYRKCCDAVVEAWKKKVSPHHPTPSLDRHKVDALDRG
jgi:recyclin-1